LRRQREHAGLSAAGFAAVSAIDYAEIARIGVATIYEAAGRHGLIDVELHCSIPGARAAGPALTVACGQDDNLMLHAAIESIRPGDVVVVTMPEPRPIALIGDLLASQARARGAAAVLVDASMRDVEEIAALGLPVWARYVRVRGATKDTPGALDVPVRIGGTTIAPGDLVVLDADGACALPAADVQSVVDAAHERERREAESRKRFAAGELSLDLLDLRRLVEP
jgi:4-hydroxy-4-methyl-2-oxoglutarate aldolase